MVMLDERKGKILEAIILDYVATAEPVGSRAVSRKYGLGVSSATVRNEMADLEELGFLEQPHASAGRIPSDQGYRYYLDHMMRRSRLGQAEMRRICNVYSRKAREIQWMLRQTAKLLAESAHAASLAVGPYREDAIFRSLRVLPLEGEQALLVLVGDTGVVEHQILDLPPGMTVADLEVFSAYLTDRWRGLPFRRLASTSVREIYDNLSRYRRMLDDVLDFLRERREREGMETVQLVGASHVLEQPEFRDPAKVRVFLECLEREDLMAELLEQREGSTGVTVTIGEENAHPGLRGCALVTASFGVGGRTQGQVGVLGPKRMEYPHVVALVEFVAHSLTQELARTFGD